MVFQKKTLFSLLHKKTKNNKKMASYSTHNIKVGDSISPQFFTGFVQADGCFHINIQKDSTAKHKIRLKPSFYVTQLNISTKKISPLLRLGRDLLQTKKKGITSMTVEPIVHLYA